jgi:hypothetical protein
VVQKLDNHVSGYKLLDLGNHWEFHFDGGIFRGGLKQVCTYAVLQHGFDTDELETGVLEMNNHFHNGAEFGIMKRFMFTFERDINELLH